MAVRYNPLTGRHSWQKRETHVYGCQWCGLGKYNQQQPGGRVMDRWVTWWRSRDGVVTNSVAAAMPRCDGGLIQEERALTGQNRDTLAF